MNAEHKEIWIGAVTITLLVGILGVMNQRQLIGADVAATQKRVLAKFNKVDGLSEGSAVRMGGVRIGSVAKMDLDEKYRAVVTLDIDKGYPYPKDTSASIHTDGLFGGKFVVLEPGAEEAVIQTGDEIFLTQDAVIVSELLELIISEGKAAMAKRLSDKE